MKEKVTAVLLLLFISTALTAQPLKDNSLANVEYKVDGLYIFIGCVPVQEYTVIDKMELDESTGGRIDDKLREAITKAKKKHNKIDGIMFNPAVLQTAEFIVFRGKEATLKEPVSNETTTGVVFKAGDKIVRRDGDVLKYGEIAIVDNVKKKVTIKYINEYGEEKSTDVATDKISLIGDSEYQKQMNIQKTEIQKHQFNTGEKVSWFNTNKLNYGEVTTLINPKHAAIISYFDKFGDVKTETINFLKLEKLNESTYSDFIKQQKIEIEKHQFSIGEKVSFVDNKITRVGEVTALNNATHRATIKFPNIFGEEKTINFPYFDLEKITAVKFIEENEKYAKEILKYKFVAGEKVNWSATPLFNKPELIKCEIVSLDNVTHKAVVKYLDKENKEKQATVGFLDLSKVNE